MKEFLKLLFVGIASFTVAFILFTLIWTTLNISNEIAMPVIFLPLWITAWSAFSRILKLKLAPSSFSDKKSEAERIAELEKTGVLQREHFRAIRAFAVEEFEDEGSQYFIELEDKRVLFLIGQYLWYSEPFDNSPTYSTPRTFPCTEFEILRHQITKDAWEIHCLGTVIKPECTTPHFTDIDQIPEDGTIISDRSYDEIKMERANPTIAKRR